jgi:hypothetical protein
MTTTLVRPSDEALAILCYAISVAGDRHGCEIESAPRIETWDQTIGGILERGIDTGLLSCFCVPKVRVSALFLALSLAFRLPDHGITADVMAQWSGAILEVKTSCSIAGI